MADTANPAPIEELLNTQREQLQAQLEELRPQVEAFHRIESILNAWDGVVSGSANGRSARGSRAPEFIHMVQEAGDGITVTEIANKMGLDKPNYLYKIAADLVNEGQVRKEGKRYFPVEGAGDEDGEGVGMTPEEVAEADAEGKDTPAKGRSRSK